MRSWKSTLLQLLAPLFFLLLITGLSYLPEGLEDVPHPSAHPLGTLPKCQVQCTVPVYGAARVLKSAIHRSYHSCNHSCDISLSLVARLFRGGGGHNHRRGGGGGGQPGYEANVSL